MNKKTYLIDKFKESNFISHSSIAIQAREILQLLEPSSSILEIGPSDGSLGHLLKWCGYNYKSIDVNNIISTADYIGDFLKEDFEIGRFDLVCAFQVLEHTELIFV